MFGIGKLKNSIKYITKEIRDIEPKVHTNTQSLKQVICEIRSVEKENKQLKKRLG